MPAFQFIEKSRVGARHAYTALVTVEGVPVRWYIMRNRARGRVAVERARNMAGPCAWTALGENGISRDAHTLTELDAWFATSR